MLKTATRYRCQYDECVFIPLNVSGILGDIHVDGLQLCSADEGVVKAEACCCRGRRIDTDSIECLFLASARCSCGLRDVTPCLKVRYPSISVARVHGKAFLFFHTTYANTILPSPIISTQTSKFFSSSVQRRHSKLISAGIRKRNISHGEPCSGFRAPR